jgi:type II secretory pathway component PulC
MEMEPVMNVNRVGAGLLLAVALGLAGPAWAGPEEDQARKELEKARQEVEKARTELQQATRELARSMARVERDNPRAQYFEYMTNPDRAVLGVLIPDDGDNGEMHGVRLLAVTPGSGAEKGGLKAGDILTALNGASLAGEGKQTPQKKMREQMKKLKSGDEVKVEYERDGRRSSATVKTAAPEPEISMAPLPMIQEWIRDEEFEKWGPMASMPMFQFRGAAIRGLELAKLDEDLGAYFKTREGVLVVKAPKGSALGLKSGDVIQKIDGSAVSEPVTVLDKLRSRAAEQDVRLEIVRQGRKQELAGKIPVAQGRARAEQRQRAAVRAQAHGHADADADDDGN